MLDCLSAIALDAGRAIMAIYDGPAFAAHTKQDGSPVTAADVAAEAIILEALARAYTDIPVIAEEEVSAGRIPVVHTRFFLVDPLDGTKEFQNRNGDFTVNIALIEEGLPVCGVVYAPALGLIYAGARDGGAHVAPVANHQAEHPTAIMARRPCAQGLSVVASRSHMSAETETFISRFTVATLVSAGSSLKFCRVAAGEADLYPRLGRTMEWDTAAGDAVLRAAGGRVCTLDGAPLTYGKRQQADDVDYANPWFVAAGQFDPFTSFAATA